MKSSSVILAVDDQPQNLELLEAHLVPQGYEVVRAANGEEALARASELPDLILLDIMMPQMSGFEVLRKLRADKKTRLIPVVMVTALKETEDKIRALEAGCDDFITKPIDKVELLARVKSILRISHYIKQLNEQEKFKAGVDKVSDGIAICTPDYIIKDCNAAALKYLSISDPANVNLAEALFENYSVSLSKAELMDPSVAHKKIHIVREASETTEAVYLEANSDVIKNSAGELLSVIFILRDVTAARREEIMKQDSLILMSHKMRMPLGVISGNVSLLQDRAYGSLDAEQKKEIDSIAKQSSLLVSMVEELLGFTIVRSYPKRDTRPKQKI